VENAYIEDDVPRLSEALRMQNNTMVIAMQGLEA
jgi:hypothetical protein